MSSHAKIVNFLDYLKEQTMFNLFRYLAAVKVFIVGVFFFNFCLKFQRLAKDQLALNDVQRNNLQEK